MKNEIIIDSMFELSHYKLDEELKPSYFDIKEICDEYGLSINEAIDIAKENGYSVYKFNEEYLDRPLIIVSSPELTKENVLEDINNYASIFNIDEKSEGSFNENLNEELIYGIFLNDNDKPMEVGSKKEMEEIKKHLESASPEGAYGVRNRYKVKFIGQTSWESLEEDALDVDFVSAKHLANIYDKEGNLIETKIFQSRKQLDDYLEKYNIYDMSSTKDIVDYKNKKFMGNVWKVIVDLSKNEDIEVNKLNENRKIFTGVYLKNHKMTDGKVNVFAKSAKEAEEYLNRKEFIDKYGSFIRAEYVGYLKEDINDDFWNLRSLKEPKYGTGNLVIDGDKIRPLTKDELANKFAVSIEHADKDDFKTKEELIDFANKISAEKIMFYFEPGDNYSGEYSFLLSGEDAEKKVRDIWKEYDQISYAKYDEKGVYHEIKESLNEFKEDEEMECIHYPKLDVILGGEYHPATWGNDGGEPGYYDDFETTVEYEYFVPVSTVKEALFDIMVDNDEPRVRYLSNEDIIEYINKNYESLLDRYYNELMKYFEEDASDEASASGKFDYQDFLPEPPEYDPYEECLDENVTSQLKVRDNDNIEEESKKCPLPIDVIPNNMGINLCNVDKVEWEEQDDGQLKKVEIDFIPSDDLEEDIEKHDTLNPKLFDGEELRPEVKETIEKIANTFVQELNEDGIRFTLKDIVLLGSNVSYNYTKDSDLDIHLIADSSGLECPDDLYPLLYSAYRSIFNKNYDITIKGIPAEIYVEMDEPQAMSNGIYSLNQGWLKKPEQKAIPDLDREAFEKLFKEWEDKYFDLIERVNEELSDDIYDFIEDLYDLRKESIASEGEYGLGNLVFKEFRNLGYLDNLKELRKVEKGKELSLESIDTSSKDDIIKEDSEDNTMNDDIVYGYKVPSDMIGYYKVEFFDNDGRCLNHWLSGNQIQYFKNREDAVKYIDEVRSWNAISFTQTLISKIR